MKSFNFRRRLEQYEEATKERIGTFVISATPACGKSFCYNNYNGKPLIMLDSDSSKFSWIEKKAEDGTCVKERNPNFKEEYMRHIMDNIGKVDIIFVSSHKEIRDELEKRGIRYIMIHPSLDMKDEMLRRMRERGNDDKFIEYQEKMFEEFYQEIVSHDDANLQGKWPLDRPKYPYDNKIYRIELTKTHPYINNELLCTLAMNKGYIQNFRNCIINGNIC